MHSKLLQFIDNLGSFTIMALLARQPPDSSTLRARLIHFFLEAISHLDVLELHALTLTLGTDLHGRWVAGAETLALWAGCVAVDV
jgi:hypothetical protein